MSKVVSVLSFDMDFTQFHILNHLSSVEEMASRKLWTKAVLYIRFDSFGSVRIPVIVSFLYSASQLYLLMTIELFWMNMSHSQLFFFVFDKKCCSGRSVLPPSRTFSSSQREYDQMRSFTSW